MPGSGRRSLLSVVDGSEISSVPETNALAGAPIPAPIIPSPIACLTSKVKPSSVPREPPTCSTELCIASVAPSVTPPLTSLPTRLGAAPKRTFAEKASTAPTRTLVPREATMSSALGSSLLFFSALLKAISPRT